MSVQGSLWYSELRVLWVRPARQLSRQRHLLPSLSSLPETQTVEKPDWGELFLVSKLSTSRPEVSPRQSCCPELYLRNTDHMNKGPMSTDQMNTGRMSTDQMNTGPMSTGRISTDQMSTGHMNTVT